MSRIERIKAYRAQGKSLFEAKRIVEYQDLNKRILAAKNIEDIKLILWRMNRLEFKDVAPDLEREANEE